MQQQEDTKNSQINIKMWLKPIHFIFALSFPMLGQLFKTIPEKKHFNYLGYFRFLLILLGLILFYLNEDVFSKKKSKIMKDYLKISRYSLVSIITCMIANLFLYLPNYLSMFIFLFGMIFVIFVGIFLNEKTKNVGINDIIFVFFIIPIFLILSKIIMFSEFSILPTLVSFGPCNFLFFILCITFNSQEYIEKYNDLNNIFSVFKLLGKQDSFRTILMFIIYLYIHLLKECYSQKSMK